jgi:2-dehydro-3-deoxyphosphogluconate aldolase/(4S)-4-hydroxy-2-oxoglutarate aldolase
MVFALVSLAGGISIVEITMRVPNATAVIRQVVRRYGANVLTGAGRVLTSDEAKQCLDVRALSFSQARESQFQL